MSEYIERSDYSVNVQDRRMQQIIEDNTDLLEEAEETAISMVVDALHSMYDTDAIFTLRGSDRHKNVLRWCKCLVLYYIYERIPDKLVPERVKNNYIDTLNTLDKISDGRKSVLLPHLETESGEKIIKLRWGSSPKKSY